MLLGSILLIIVSTGSVARAQEWGGGKIGVAWDPEGLVCEQSVAPGTVGTFYILAYLTGFFGGGTTGAEFRVDGFPSEWFMIGVTPNPQSNIQLGNPMAGGCNIAFPNCQTGTNQVALLYTVQFYAPSLVTERVLSVQRHTTPSNPDFACPRLVTCDAPCFCASCSIGGTAAINFPEHCVVGVASRSWSEVRSLYR
jgi:hypothetical protein